MSSIQDIVRLLIIDASFEETERVSNVLRNLGFAIRVLRVTEEESLRKALESRTWELIICAATLPKLSITQVLCLLQQSEKDVPLIVVVDKETDPDTIDGVYRAGARDVVPKDHPLRLQCVAKRELEDLQNRRACRRSERLVAEGERRIRTLLDSSRDAVAYVYEGMHLYANRAYLGLFGCNGGLDELESIPLLDMAAPVERNRFKVFLKEYTRGSGGHAQFSLTARKADGSTFVATLEFTPTSIEGEPCTQIIIRDKAGDSGLEEKIEQLQQRDRLTGLFNRHYFLELMEEAVSVARAGGDESNLFYMALDSFNRARERFGLGAGDVVVGEVAQILQRHCQSVCLARFGDEAFALIVAQAGDDQVDILAERLRQAVEEYLVEVGRYTINVTCSIGICRIGESAPGVQPIVERAYKACLKAQAEGGNRVKRYSPVASDLTEQEKVKQWEKQLRWALSHDNFRLLYQPVVSLHGRMEALFEVLLRLVDDGDVYISLEEFLEPADRLGLMGKIDRWMIGKGAQVLQIRYQEGQATRFFIKLSDSSIQDTGLVSWIEALLQTTQLQANSLIFEISENAALNYLKRAQTLIQGMRALGCRFALEHFGAGLDMSNCLKHLNVDYIKISGAFIENLLRDKQNQAAVKAIIKMAQKAGKSTIAESVSNANTLALLWQLGVDYAQGYYVQEPSELLSYDFTGEV